MSESSSESASEPEVFECFPIEEKGRRRRIAGRVQSKGVPSLPELSKDPVIVSRCLKYTSGKLT